MSSYQEIVPAHAPQMDWTAWDEDQTDTQRQERQEEIERLQDEYNRQREEEQQRLEQAADQAAESTMRAALSVDNRMLDVWPSPDKVDFDSVRAFMLANMPTLDAAEIDKLLEGQVVMVRIPASPLSKPVLLYNGDAFAEPDPASGLDPLLLVLPAIPVSFLARGFDSVLSYTMDNNDIDFLPASARRHVAVWMAARSDPKSRVWRAMYTRYGQMLVASGLPFVYSLVAPNWRKQLNALLSMHGNNVVVGGGAQRRLQWVSFADHLAGPRALTLAADMRTVPPTLVVKMSDRVQRANPLIQFRVRLVSSTGTFVYSCSTKTTVPLLVKQEKQEEDESGYDTDEERNSGIDTDLVELHVVPGETHFSLLRVGSGIRMLLGDLSPRLVLHNLLVDDDEDDDLFELSHNIDRAASSTVLCHLISPSIGAEVRRQLFASTLRTTLREFDRQVVRGNEQALQLFGSSDSESLIDPRRFVTVRIRLSVEVRGQSAQARPELTVSGLRRNSVFVANHSIRSSGRPAVTAHLLHSDSLSTYFKCRSDGETTTAQRETLSASRRDLRQQEEDRAVTAGLDPDNTDALELASVLARQDALVPSETLSDRAWNSQLPDQSIPLTLDDEESQQVLQQMEEEKAGLLLDAIPVRPATSLSSSSGGNALLFGNASYYQDTKMVPGVHLGLMISKLHPRPDVARRTTNVGLAVHDSENALLDNGIDLIRVVLYVDTVVYTYHGIANTKVDKLPVRYANSTPITRTFGLHRSGNTVFALPYVSDIGNIDANPDDPPVFMHTR